MFHENHFRPELPPGQAKLAASIANELLNSGKCAVVYGVEREGGVFEGFGSEKSRDASHVALLFDSTLMGIEKPSKVPVKITTVSHEERIQALMEANKQLEAQVKS